MTSVEELLIELLKIESVSGNEKAIGEFIVKRLKKNFEVKILKVNNNFNILAVRGSPKIIVSAHIDTVPGKLPIKKDKNFIYGRGSCDTKSQVASGIIAGEKAVSDGLTDFALLFTVEEETDFSGAKVLEKFGLKNVKLCVLGEPTNLKIVNGHKGILTLKLISEGKACHSSIPEKGKNAIDLLVKDLQEIKKLKFPENKELGKNTLSVNQISGGTADNVVPDKAEAIIDVRVTTDSAKILDKIKKSVKSKVVVLNNFNPFFNREVKAIAKLLNSNAVQVTYFTEAGFVSKIAPTIILGAGSISDAHTINEKVPLSELNRLVQMHYKLIEKFSQE